MREKGQRVVAISSADDEEVRIFGYGIYVGDEVPPKGTPGVFGIDLGELLIKNPKIVLDNGGVVWGCQCWWGDAERFDKEKLGDRKIVEVPLPAKEDS